jgi:hypothetical protein
VPALIAELVCVAAEHTQAGGVEERAARQVDDNSIGPVQALDRLSEAVTVRQVDLSDSRDD